MRSSFNSILTASGLGSYVESLFRKSNIEFSVSSHTISASNTLLQKSNIKHSRQFIFVLTKLKLWTCLSVDYFLVIRFIIFFFLQVVIAQMNGRNYSSRSAHCFHVGKTKLKLGKGWITKARDSYSKSMQVFGENIIRSSSFTFQ